MGNKDKPLRVSDHDNETFAWRHAAHLTYTSPAYGIAACWLRYRCANGEDMLRDDAICRDIRGAMAWHAWAHQVGAKVAP